MKFSELQRLQRMEGITVLSADERIEQLEARLRTITKERDTLRAKITETEKQEPVAEMVDDDFGKQIKGINYWWQLPNGAKLYALPGAQTQLNEIKIALQRALELGQRETWTGARKHRSWEDQREEQQCWNKVWSLLGAKGEKK